VFAPTKSYAIINSESVYSTLKGLTAVSQRSSRHQIEQFAQQTLRAHGLDSIPVDPVLLANRLGITVNHATFSEANISGVIAKRGDSAVILVNSNDSPYRKRFTIAHELGHFLLHLQGIDGEEVDRTADLFRTSDSADRLPVRKEVQANQFAAALLMPGDHVKQMWKSVQSVEELARIFNVSEEAMGYRLASLGLLTCVWNFPRKFRTW
jgi:Zn-dependent peptidase ImmA (M78 family)